MGLDTAAPLEDQQQVHTSSEDSDARMAFFKTTNQDTRRSVDGCSTGVGPTLTSSARLKRLSCRSLMYSDFTLLFQQAGPFSERFPVSTMMDLQPRQEDGYDPNTFTFSLSDLFLKLNNLESNIHSVVFYDTKKPLVSMRCLSLVCSVKTSGL